MDEPTSSDLIRDLVRELRRRILAWEYPPQRQLTEESLCQEFGVSRSPIRQAMTHLAAEGLLERLPRKGFRVKQLQLRDVEELYELRLALETQVVQSLAAKGLPEATLSKLHTTWSNSAALTGESITSLASHDEAFHSALAEAHGNRLIQNQLAKINERLFAFREIDFSKTDRLSSTCDEHLKLLAAIVARDATAATDLVRKNIHSGLGNVETAIVHLVARSYLKGAVP